MKPPGRIAPSTRIRPPGPVAAVAVVLIASIAVVVASLIGNRGNHDGLLPTHPPALTVQTPVLEPAAAFAAHVDATFNTISAIFEDAEGSSLEQFASDSAFAATEDPWISSQPRLPCLTAAAAQDASAFASLKAAMDASVEDYEAGNSVAVASLNAQTDPARSTLLAAKEAVDEAAARC